jgi:putative toxin-antitoxin system antitoxin component (TIGR02293 family)
MSSRTAEELLGIPSTRHIGELGKRILKGLPFRSLTAFQRITAATEAEISHILWMPTNKFQRRRKTGHLSPAESDRLFGAARILAFVLHHFQNDEKRAQAWLRAPASPKHHVPPISLMGTFGGLELVYHYLEDAYFELYLKERSNSSKKSKRKTGEYDDPLDILGLKRSPDIDDRIRRGFPFISFELFRKRSLFTVAEMRQILRVSSAYLSKYRSLGRLPGHISDRLYRTAVAYFFVHMMVGSEAEYAKEWLHEPTAFLSSHRPIDLLRTDPDTDEVIAAACRVLDGMAA